MSGNLLLFGLWAGLVMLFLLIEITAPYFVALFFAAGALLTFFFHMGWTALYSQGDWKVRFLLETVFFFISSLALLVMARRKLKETFRGEERIGRYREELEGAVGETITAVGKYREGRVRVKGSFYRARLAVEAGVQEIPPRTPVRVIRFDSERATMAILPLDEDQIKTL